MKMDNKEFARSLTGEQVRTILEINNRLLRKSLNKVEGLQDVSELTREQGKRDGIIEFLMEILNEG